MPNEHDRNVEERRKNIRRPSHVDRRQGGDRRTDAYKAFARRLPAAYLSMVGSPRERVTHLVRQYCSGCNESLQADLAQALLPTLQAIVTLDGGVVSEEHRLDCEEVVARCVMQNELATGRWKPACEDEPGLA